MITHLSIISRKGGLTLDPPTIRPIQPRVANMEFCGR